MTDDQWAKIYFPENKDPAETNNEFTYEVMGKFRDKGEPRGFAVFSGDDANGRHFWLLTPKAARHCGLLIRVNKGDWLDKSEIDPASADWLCGDELCRNWLRE